MIGFKNLKGFFQPEQYYDSIWGRIDQMKVKLEPIISVYILKSGTYSRQFYTPGFSAESYTANLRHLLIKSSVFWTKNIGAPAGVPLLSLYSRI